MAYQDDKPDDFTKPSRQNRGGKRRKGKEKAEIAPKEVYKRQKVSKNDVFRVLDEEDFENF